MRVLRAILVAVAVLVCLDLLLGMVAAPGGNLLYDPDPHLFWRMKANVKEYVQNAFERGDEKTQMHISTNSLGLRDDELGDKAPNEFRVLCVGDSSIFGHGVELADTFEKQLEARLRKALPGRTVRVVNGGVSGYSSFQGRLFFHELAPKVKPDVVVLGYYFSDFIPDTMPDRERVPPGTATSAFSRALARSHLYQFIRDEMEKQAKQQAASTQGKSLVARVSPADYRDNMEAMAAESLAMNAKVVLLLLTPRDTTIPEGQKPYREAMAALSSARGVPLADMERPFSKPKDRAALFVDEVHPSPAGDAIVADELFETMQKAGMIGAPAGAAPSPHAAP